jgi:hypothetical protein
MICVVINAFSKRLRHCFKFNDVSGYNKVIISVEAIYA